MRGDQVSSKEEISQGWALEPLCGSSGRQPAGAGVGSVSIAAERPPFCCTQQRIIRGFDGRRHNKKRKAARLGTEIGWKIEVGHQEEGGEAFQKPFLQAVLQDSPASSPEAPLQNPELDQPSGVTMSDPVISQKYRLRPERLHEIVTAAIVLDPRSNSQPRILLVDSPVPRESHYSPETFSENWILLRPGNYGAGVLEGLRVGQGR